MSRKTIFLCESYDRATGAMIWREAYLPVLAFSDVIKRDGNGWWQVKPGGARQPIEMVTQD